ncbi:MAG: hypothetical protein K6B41_07755 [Butyrivibrio sp.]|nr:hypothetical protein [Butyrivibrio sp.]
MVKRLDHYKKVLEKNPAYIDSSRNVMEELESVSSFSNNRDIETKDVVIKDNQLLHMREHYIHTCAPVITEYALWVIRNAIKDGIDKLYFLSRDAYPVYLAAKKVITIYKTEKEKIPELHYLRVSRYALRIPEMAIKGDAFLDMMFLSGIDVTMRKILGRGALTENEMKLFAEIIGFERPLDEILSRPEILALKEKAKAHKEELAPMVQAHGRDKLPLVLGYLRQEGMLDGSKCAIVDSGWIGTTQRSLQKLLRLEKPELELKGYYFGLYEIPKEMKKENYKSFYFAPRNGIMRKTLFSNCLFEAVSSEKTGMTLSYEKNDDGKFIAKLSEGGSLNGQFLSMTEEIITLYAAAYVKYHRKDTGYRISPGILKTLMANPDDWEACSYGNLFFCDDVLETDKKHIAADLSYEDICNLRLINKIYIWFRARFRDDSDGKKTLPTIHESGWIYASIVRCNISKSWSLFNAKLYNFLMYLRKSIR